MVEFKKKPILPKHKYNKNNNKNNQNLSLGAKVFFDELKRLNKGPDIEFKETGVIDGGASIIFRIFKKYTLKHKMPAITAGTTALYNIRRNKNQKSTQTSDIYSYPTNQCYCYTNRYDFALYPITQFTPFQPNSDVGVATITCDDSNAGTQSFYGELANIPYAQDFSTLLCIPSTDAISVCNSNYNIISTNPSLRGGTCNGNNFTFTYISQAMGSYDASIKTAREKTGFVNSTLPPGKYSLKVTGAGYTNP